MKKGNLIVLIMFFIISSKLCAQQELDNYFEHLFENKKMMGSVAVSLNDSIIYTKSVGYINVNSKKEIDENTKFRVGSTTKTYTAVLILKAVEEGKIKLDDKLSIYYPQIKNAEKITIDDLLKHRTGISNYTRTKGISEWEQSPHNEEEIISLFSNLESDFEPNSEFEYSNTNYMLLGFILQKIYNKTYAKILEEKIVYPLKLKNTYFTSETDETKNEAISYNIQNKYIKNADVNFSNNFATGGIASTPTELNVFLTALFNGKLISEKSLDLMLPNTNGEYGYGIFKYVFDDNTIIYEHDGRVENYISSYWYFPDEKIGIVTLTNAINISISNINYDLYLNVYEVKPELTDFNIIDGMSKNEFQEIKGTYFNKANELETVTISSDGENLVYQHSKTGQMFVPFIYKGNNIFDYEDIILEFSPSKKELIENQRGNKTYYIKKNSN